MVFRVIASLVIGSVFCGSLIALAKEEKTEGSTNKYCDSCATTPSQLSKITKISKDLEKENQTRWIDANFLFEVESDKSGTLNIQPYQYDTTGLTTEAYTRVFSIYSGSFGEGTSLAKVSNFNQSLEYVKTNSETLSPTEKLTLLSMIGSRLAAGYSDDKEQNTDLNALFLNAKNNQADGGICGDIHTYLTKMAEALGFESAGIHSGRWMKDGKDKANGHAVAYFKDKKTGEFYMQNYSTVYKTGQKTVQSAVEVGSRILGPFAGQIDVSSGNGKVHLYVPQTAQWVKNQIEGVGLKPFDAPVVGLKIGNKEQAVSAQLSYGKDNSFIRGFAMASQYKAAEGDYSLEAVGLSYVGKYTKEFEGRVIDEVGLSTKVYGGMFSITAPNFSPNSSERKKTYENGFGSATLTGTARINSTTGKLEILARTLDSKTAETELSAGVEHQWKNLPIRTGVERTFQLVPQSTTLNNPLRPQTKYDKVSIIYDGRGENKKYYIQADGDLYLLDGMDKMSAVGVRNSVKAVVPAGNLGTFAIGAEIGKIIQNKSKDPYYDLPASKSAFIEWGKTIMKATDLGAQVSYTKGPLIQPFGTIGPITPQFSDGKSQVKGVIYLKVAL